MNNAVNETIIIGITKDSEGYSELHAFREGGLDELLRRTETLYQDLYNDYDRVFFRIQSHDWTEKYIEFVVWCVDADFVTVCEELITLTPSEIGASVIEFSKE